MICTLELSYHGGLAENHQLQFYDAAQALWGFERTITLTTHLLLNGKVITQSPSARGFHVLATPPEAGSWKMNAVIGLGTTIGAFGLAPPDTQFGWLAKSAVEYVIQEALGFTPDFDKTLGSQIRSYRGSTDLRSLPEDLSQTRFDSVIEKCEGGLRAMHRPIVYSGSAEIAQIGYQIGGSYGRLGGYFDSATNDYISQTVTSEDIEEFCGSISSYNINTFRGRIYFPDQKRTVPFELSPEAQSIRSISRITESLRSNAIAERPRGSNGAPDICLMGFRNETSTGRLKKIYVTTINAIDGPE